MDLFKLLDISPAMLVKLGNNEPVNMMVLLRICEALTVNVAFVSRESEVKK